MTKIFKYHDDIDAQALKELESYKEETIESTWDIN